MSFGFGFGFPKNYIAALFSPAQLFTGSTNGVWYDPSDLNTLFQDAAGTTPVTAVEQPVGLMLDKSGRGNHAFNSSGNSANFPVLSARYNLLTKTEDFSDAAWTKNNSTITANAIAAPNGSQTADKLVENIAATIGHFVQPNPALSFTAGQTITYSVYAKAAERSFVQLVQTGIGPTGGNLIAGFDLGNGTAVTPTAGTTSSIVPVGNGWYICSFTTPVSTTAASTTQIRLALNSTSNPSSYTGDGTSGIYIWGADLRVSNDALNQPTYQRVNTATDYDTVGFKPYLKFNGTNQWLQTNSIDFTYGDKMFVCAGVRKLSDAATGVIAELSNSLGGNNGVVSAIAPSGSNLFAWYSKGTVLASALTVDTIYIAPKTVVMSGLGDIGGATCTMRLNTAASTNSASQGTGNYGNYPLYIGARAGSSLWFNGRLHQLVVAGKQVSASGIGQTEAFTDQKTGAY